MGHLQEPLRVMYRPLAFYLVMELFMCKCKKLSFLLFLSEVSVVVSLQASGEEQPGACPPLSMKGYEALLDVR